MDLLDDLIVGLSHAFTEPLSNPQNVVSFFIFRIKSQRNQRVFYLWSKYNACMKIDGIVPLCRDEYSKFQPITSYVAITTPDTGWDRRPHRVNYKNSRSASRLTKPLTESHSPALRNIP